MASGKQMKILLIEDDALFRGLIGSTLGKNGYTVTVAADGEHALTKILAEDFDMVITDLFMPNKEGFEVIQEIRAKKPHIRIIAMSSDGLAGYSSFLKMAEAFGADATLRKPFSPEQLIEKINKLEDHRKKFGN